MILTNLWETRPCRKSERVMKMLKSAHDCDTMNIHIHLTKGFINIEVLVRTRQCSKETISRRQSKCKIGGVGGGGEVQQV